MVSSTFTDLKEHRQKAIDTIAKQGFRPEVMEFSGANADTDVLDTSLAMVRDAAAYIGVIGHKYGQTPESEERNPDRLSVTELEFNEAMRLDRPILLFIMSDEHDCKKGDIEVDPVKIGKLEAFRQRAKLMQADGKIQRIYEMFDSVDDFALKAANAIALLTKNISSQPVATILPQPAETTLPAPPALRAMPRYRGSHPFVGRKAQLETLDEWASPANPNPVLLFEAMGGSGKSLLTWHWTTECADLARGDWAGRFWYSFYEKGAVMADFCRQALAYMTDGKPADFEKQPQSKLTEQLLAELNAKPWLMVLDGLERVLVAYHRSDAAQMLDEEADTATDPMGKREPCRAIRREDDDLLAALAGADPSRVLISTRLTPLALLSPSNTPVPGVRQELLPGLRPEDAEAMMRACGITGEGAKMRTYLQANCDCHPLVTGVIAGLINKNVRAPGNFDKWVTDPKGGGALNLGALDLAQRRNHILGHAIDGVKGDDAYVLNLLSLFPRAADYDVLLELAMKNDAHDEARLQTSLERLRQHGLVQYDDNAGGYDLHPVVRGVVAGRMDEATTEVVGGALVDHFTAVQHNPWENAHALEDVQSGIDLVATLLRLGRFEAACDACTNDFVNALFFNLDAREELQQLLLKFFPNGWNADTVGLETSSKASILHVVGLLFSDIDPDQCILMFERALEIDLSEGNLYYARGRIRNISGSVNEFDIKLRLLRLVSEIADIVDDRSGVFSAKIDFYEIYSWAGISDLTDKLKIEIDRMGRDWDRGMYRPGIAEYFYAQNMFYCGVLTAAFIDEVQALAEQGCNRYTKNSLIQLRGLWQLECRDNEAALHSFDAAILMTHERGREDDEAEAWRALALARLGAHDEARANAERLGYADTKAAIALAELWYDLGDQERALAQAHRAHDWAVGSGEPYVHRYWLNRINALFDKMGVTPPEVPDYDPDAHPPYPWEAHVRALIDKLKAEREAEEQQPESS